jgi:hypothetical protein
VILLSLFPVGPDFVLFSNTLLLLEAIHDFI